METETGLDDWQELSSPAAQAYLIFRSSSVDVQALAGYDGWLTLVHEDFETEDLAWPHEQARLEGLSSWWLRYLEASGVLVGELQLNVAFNLCLEPPDDDVEEQRIWCIESFPESFDFVVSSDHPMQRARVESQAPACACARWTVQSLRSGCSPSNNSCRSQRRRLGSGPSQLRRCRFPRDNLST